MNEFAPKHHREIYYHVDRPQLERHHKIWKCLGKVFPHSRGLKEAIKSPNNIQLVTHAEHQKLNECTPEVFNWLINNVKGRPYKETVIPRRH